MYFQHFDVFWQDINMLRSMFKSTHTKKNNQPLNKKNINSPYLLTAKQRWSHVLLRSLPTAWYLGQSYHFFFDPLLNCFCTSTYRTEEEEKKIVLSTLHCGEERAMLTSPWQPASHKREFALFLQWHLCEILSSPLEQKHRAEDCCLLKQFPGRCLPKPDYRSTTSQTMLSKFSSLTVLTAHNRNKFVQPLYRGTKSNSNRTYK